MPWMWISLFSMFLSLFCSWLRKPVTKGQLDIIASLLITTQLINYVERRCEFFKKYCLLKNMSWGNSQWGQIMNLNLSLVQMFVLQRGIHRSIQDFWCIQATAVWSRYVWTCSRDTLNISIIWMPQSLKCLKVDERHHQHARDNTGHTGLKCFTV